MNMNGEPRRAWVLSDDTLPVGKDKAIGVRLNEHQVMWVGGEADEPADNNRAFVYDVKTRTFHEISPVPAAKHMNAKVVAGVLQDGSVIVAGGSVQGAAGATSRLSYRYEPGRDRWSRTGDLPEPQEWIFTPATQLHDGRLLIAGGIGLDGVETGTGSLNAFIFDEKQQTEVPAIDPVTGIPTGELTRVQGKWDYTRRTNDNVVSTLGRGHVFGNAVLLEDGRVFVIGGHTFWNVNSDVDTSALATDTDYFDPETGVWATGAPLPPVVGEDDRIPGSHGGRTNGIGVAVLDNGKVVIAGGNSQTDGESYFGTAIGRRSIIVMTAASDPSQSTYQLAANRIPDCTDFGGLFGDGGRNQLLCYATSKDRVVIAGGQSTAGEDLFDTYVFDSRTGTVTRGPDMVHNTPAWLAQHPEWGYPDGYETATISSRAVCMNNSKLVFSDHTLVHGGAYNGVGDDTFPGSRYVEQAGHGPEHQHRNPPSHPTDAHRAAAIERNRRRGWAGA
jgi:hypothetical protein